MRGPWETPCKSCPQPVPTLWPWPSDKEIPNPLPPPLHLPSKLKKLPHKRKKKSTSSGAWRPVLSPTPATTYTFLAMDGLVNFSEPESPCCFSVPSTPLFFSPVPAVALLDVCDSGRFPKGCVCQPGAPPARQPGDLQKSTQTTLLFAPILYCCWARCQVLSGPGRGGPDQFPTLCGQ